MEARFLTLGDAAVTVEFGNEISLEINARVNALFSALKTRSEAGIVEMVPTYRSLTIHYRPECLTYARLLALCREELDRLPEQTAGGGPSRVVTIPVLYGGERGEDLEDVATYHHKTPQEIVEAHSGHLHRIYMIGFWPGMPYMDAPSGLTIPRRATPRVNVSRGSVIIQSTQTNILPNDTPTGWHVIGHTPVRPFDLNREEPSLFRPGDWVRFVPVEREEYEEISRQTDLGKYQVRIEEKEG